ncbi:MAG TPA: hypothetical protein VNM14_02970 [Planctomycetota bacterium]|jgi:hypothetical protein|nr:hypothetical protein [Planctomycetota bacterium]
MKKPRRRQSETAEPEGHLQAMGGKEERVSRVGQARADAERIEQQGEALFDITPGPDTNELLHGQRRPATKESKTKLRQRKVSPQPRGGPVGPEPEDVAEAPKRAKRRPTEPLPFEHDDSEG